MCTTLHLYEDFCTMMPLPWSKDVHVLRHTHIPSPTLGTHLQCSLTLESVHTCTMLSPWNLCTHVQCSLTLEFLLKCNLLTHPGTSVHKPTADLQWNFCTHANSHSQTSAHLYNVQLLSEMSYTCTHPGISVHMDNAHSPWNFKKK